MISPLATPLDVTNNGSCPRVEIAGSLKEDLCEPHRHRIRDLKGRKRLLSLLRLAFDQAFRRGWSFAGRRFEFFAARIVVRNKEVFNFAYQL